MDGSRDYNSAAPPPSTTPNTNSSGPNPLLPRPLVDSFSSSDADSDQEDPEDENLPVRPAHSATWAGRNAARPVIKSRMPARPLTQAVKQARKIVMEQKREANKQLQKAVTLFIEEQNAKMEEIAKAHNVKVKRVESLVISQTQYRSTRKAQLYNALVSAKAREVNAGKYLLLIEYFTNIIHRP